MTNEFYTVRGYERKDAGEKLLTPAMEDYLEMIYRSSQVESNIRIKTIAKRLNVKDSSATKMVQKLGELGMLNYERYGRIELTPKGKATGAYLLKRHAIIENFFCLIGSEEDALLHTERVEHVLADDTIRQLNMLWTFMREHPDIYEKYKAFKQVYQGTDLSNQTKAD